MIGTQTLAQKTHSKAAATAPLSSHAAFTPAVMVWFAALLGLSVLAIRGSLLESWVIDTRIDLFLPIATPPLGAGLRLLLAAGFACLGAGLGWLVARTLRPATASNIDDFQLRQRDRHPDAPARRPISAHAELGEEGFGRASSARDDFLADLPAFRTSAVDPFPAGAFDAPATPVFTTEPHAPPPVQAAQGIPASTPVFADVAQSAPASAVTVRSPASYATPAAAYDDAHYDLPVIDFENTAPPSVEPKHVAEAEVPAAQVSDEALPSLASETDVAPVRPVLPLRAVSSLPVAKPAAATAAEAPSMIGATPVKPRTATHERITQAPLGDLSHLELIERLAMAIHTREKEKGTALTAVNDTQDMPTAVAPNAVDDDLPAIQTHLRTALAGLREVK